MPQKHCWNFIQSISFIGSVGLFLILGSFIPLVIVAFVCFLILGRISIQELKNMSPWGGYANYITLIRLFLISLISVTPFSEPIIFAIALIALLLDIADGYLARKLNQVSLAGEIFDREVDAYYVLILSLLIWKTQLLPIWILVPAVMRYLFIIAACLFRLNLEKDKRTPFGPIAAGMHFIALLLPFVAPAAVYFPVTLITAILVLISFLYSFYLITR